MATQQLEQRLSNLDDDSAALFHSPPYPHYYVQSPSTTSNSAAIPPPSSSDSGAFLSPTFPSHHHHDSTCSRVTLSLYSSSSRGSKNDSYVEEKKHEVELKGGRRSNGANEEEEEEEMGGRGMKMRRRRRRGFIKKLVVLDSNESSCCCVVFHFAWRITLSLVLAIFVFFMATNPPQPEFYFKIVNVRHFSLGEGVDETGVPTKILSCNCSVDMNVVNRSRFFGLHIYPPLLEMSFETLKFASSQGQASYVESKSSSTARLFIGVKNKPLYGAGRSMEDLLESERGLTLMVRIRMHSRYRVVWGLIEIKHHHLQSCNVILQAMHDPISYAKLYGSSCVQS
ncbi:uncharacterized protein LOC110018517 [Phalaenopsis equestris]|uniref:uncharacterized protein LOC110018517 n=1 Tax=Phalaenopsis equestris TaxID=78828 RepID=UPI0009E51017|nr:uncharacterized protein LOC110018517 [Phalaenopsis equestris]